MPPFPARGADTYRQTLVQSRTPLEIVAMLYDGALRSMGEAREAIVRRDIPARHRAMSRTFAIIAELQNTLDMERGGELSAHLDRVYSYSSARLLEAAGRQDPAPIDEVRGLLEPLRDAWHTISADATAKARS